MAIVVISLSCLMDNLTIHAYFNLDRGIGAQLLSTSTKMEDGDFVEVLTF